MRILGQEKECGGFYGMTISINLRNGCEFWVRKGMMCFFGIPIPLMWELRMRILGQEGIWWLLWNDNSYSFAYRVRILD